MGRSLKYMSRFTDFWRAMWKQGTTDIDGGSWMGKYKSTPKRDLGFKMFPFADRPYVGLTNASGIIRQDDDRVIRKALKGLFFRCIDIRTDEIAHAFSQMVVERAQGREWVEVESSHPWVKLIQNPNPFLSASELWKWVGMMKDLSSSGAFLFIDRDRRNVPIAMYPVYPEFGNVVPLLNEMGGIGSYEFWSIDGRRIPIEAQNVIWIRHNSPISPIESMSLIQMAVYQLDIDLYENIYRRDSLKDGQYPPVYLSLDKPLSPEQAKSIGETFFNKYLRKQGEAQKPPPVLEQGTKVETFSVNAKDMQYFEARPINREEIFMITGVPEGMFGRAASATNNSGSQRATLYHLCIQPQAEKNASQLTFSFQRAFFAEKTLRIRVPNLVPTDPKVDAEINEIYLRSGQKTINEIRRRNGDPPIAGGDELMIPMGLTPITEFSNAL